MINHISSRPGGIGNTEPDETPQRQRRFTDQRGIALQTVIITVVMIAIAGAIAAVLFSAANDATDELENSSVSVNAYAAENEGQCTRSDGSWTDAPPAIGAGTAAAGRLAAAWNTTAADAVTRVTNNKGYCTPNS